MSKLQDHIMNHLTCGVLAIDLDHRVIQINEIGEHILKVTRNEILGESVYDIFPLAPEEVRHVERTVQTGEEFFIEAMPYKWGNFNMYLTVQTKVLIDSNRMYGAMVEFRDMTHVYQKQEELINRMEDMAVNVIPLMDQLGLLPIQPVVEEVGFHYLIDIGLQKVADMKVNTLIMDLSSITYLNDDFTEMIAKLCGALNLLGVNIMITGVRPENALRWVSSGTDYIKTTYHPHVQAALSTYKKGR
ncbi:STAS domain-containing protein [Pseudalkalibacillus hwajinpoensis]|uniref:STAS domain-containing protein n=1 Tax=Guptibacillus hwajinpoensis TaxID=208199 RepID=UPI001CFD39F5|nr:STAS domain-containing protein [Pseudalkalibacillus hwajinpoensis]